MFAEILQSGFAEILITFAEILQSGFSFAEILKSYLLIC